MRFASARGRRPRLRSFLARALAPGALALLVLAGASACAHRARGTRAPAPSLLTLIAGTRIRVFAPPLGSTPRTGHLIALRGDTLSMRADVTLDSLAVPLGAVRRVDVNTWHGSRTALGAMAGAAVGAAAGVVMSSGCTSGARACSSFGNRRSLAAIGGAGVGAGIGAVVGLALSRDRWAPVTLPAARP